MSLRGQAAITNSNMEASQLTPSKPMSLWPLWPPSMWSQPQEAEHTPHTHGLPVAWASHRQGLPSLPTRAHPSRPLAALESGTLIVGTRSPCVRIVFTQGHDRYSVTSWSSGGHGPHAQLCSSLSVVCTGAVTHPRSVQTLDAKPGAWTTPSQPVTLPHLNLKSFFR